MSQNFKINFAFWVSVLVALVIIASIALAIFGGRHGTPAHVDGNTPGVQPNQPNIAIGDEGYVPSF